MKIIFVHTGIASYLEYSIKQAEMLGYQVTLIGDEAAYKSSNSQVKFVDISDLNTQEVENFKKIYVHNSSNSYDYELFCFLRWFYIREYIRSNDRSFLVLDSDVLIYPGFFHAIQALTKNFECLINTAWCQYFGGYSQIDFLCKSFEKLFISQDSMSEVSKIANFEWTHVSDMHALIYFSKIYPQFKDVLIDAESMGMLGNIRNNNFYENIGSYAKVIGRLELSPIFLEKNGLSRTARMIHFQGISKNLMAKFSCLNKNSDIANITPRLNKSSDEVNDLFSFIKYMDTIEFK